MQANSHSFAGERENKRLRIANSLSRLRERARVRDLSKNMEYKK